MIPDESVTAPAREKWESWKPALAACLTATKGSVLEIGVGHYSTHWLHDVCQAAERTLVSCEEDKEWYEAVEGLRDVGHYIYNDSYDKLLPERTRQQWSVVFMDHSPGPRRGQDLLLFLPIADYVVIHDYHLAIEEAVKAVLPANCKIAVTPLDPPTAILSLRRELPPV